MFIFTLGGNGFYVIGIFVRAAAGTDDLLTQTPYIVTSILPFICDIIILV